MTPTRCCPSESRGMTGIGALILFISLILVAAIASGVILDTAGFLQSATQHTSDESTAEVSDRIKVLDTSGDVIEADTIGDGNIDTRYIETLRVTAFRSSGGSNIDLSQLTIEYYAAGNSAFILHEDELARLDPDTTADNIGAFTIDPLNDESGSLPVLSSGNDRASIVIDLDDAGGPNEDILDTLDESESATLRITTQHGATTLEIINVPNSLAGDHDTTILL